MPAPIRRLAAGTAVLLLASLATAVPAVADDGQHRGGHRAHGATLLKADLVGSLTTDPVLFGVSPGGADWSVSRSRVEVRTDGAVKVELRSLVLTSSGANPVPQVSASLVCNGAVVDTVGPVAYSSTGDARIEDTFTVPARCLAPTVLVHPVTRTTTYIAVSGAAR